MINRKKNAWQATKTKKIVKNKRIRRICLWFRMFLAWNQHWRRHSYLRESWYRRETIQLRIDFSIICVMSKIWWLLWWWRPRPFLSFHEWYIVTWNVMSIKGLIRVNLDTFMRIFYFYDLLNTWTLKSGRTMFRLLELIKKERKQIGKDCRLLWKLDDRGRELCWKFRERSELGKMKWDDD